MALFNGETKEEKKARKAAEAAAKQAEKDQAALRKFGLENLENPEDIVSVKTIVGELAGTGLMELGIAFGAGNDRDIQKNMMYYQRAIVEQNFIIIRQLDRIAKLLNDRWPTPIKRDSRANDCPFFRT